MKFLDMRNRLLWTFFFVAFSLGVANAKPVTITFSFNSEPISFDFGTGSTIQSGFFSYDDSNPVSVFNGTGFLLTDFQLDALSLDPTRNTFWVPAPLFDNTTIQTIGGNDDQWDLFDQDGTFRFQLLANPDGQGGFTGEILGNSTAGTVPVTFGLSSVISDVEFPAGVVSFADKVVDYNPSFGGGPVPDITQQDSRQILGVPGQGEMSLGNGGQIVVKFLDNKLTGNGNSQPDLYVFEVGAPETTLVEIRKNTGPWYSVGTATGYASGIDIDAFGFGQGDRFTSVRLTDDGDSPGGGLTPGADLVAVGAHSTIRSYSEETWLTYWIQAHVGGKSELIIRDHEVWWHHRKGTAPGLTRAFHSLGSESNSPTIFDSSQGPNIEWVPSHWPPPLGNGTHPESGAHFNALTPVFPQREWCWKLNKRLGTGHVNISQQPTKRNVYTLKIMFNDLGPGDKKHLNGSGFYSIELKTTGRGC